jgi:hypothetical protein
MKRKREIIGVVLLGLFLAYFSASFIFVPKAPHLKDQDTSVVKLENHDAALSHGLLRSASSENAEDAIYFFDEFNVISCLESFHTTSQQNTLASLANSQFDTHDIYLSLRRLQI